MTAPSLCEQAETFLAKANHIANQQDADQSFRQEQARIAKEASPSRPKSTDSTEKVRTPRDKGVDTCQNTSPVASPTAADVNGDRKQQGQVAAPSGSRGNSPSRGPSPNALRPGGRSRSPQQNRDTANGEQQQSLRERASHAPLDAIHKQRQVSGHGLSTPSRLSAIHDSGISRAEVEALLDEKFAKLEASIDAKISGMMEAMQHQILHTKLDAACTR